jgi:hypothetical protein
MNQYNLGDANSDRIISEIFDNARIIFPHQTNEAEVWINEQMAKYGLSYAKYQAERAAMTVYPWLQSPITWVVGAWILWRIFK